MLPNISKLDTRPLFGKNGDEHIFRQVFIHSLIQPIFFEYLLFILKAESSVMKKMSQVCALNEFIF